MRISGKKIIVIGCPGAGKSTFARKLRNVTGLPLFYLDMLWHRPDKTNITQQEFDKKLCSITEQTEWIIDGNYLRTLEIRLKVCDTVFFLNYPLDVCIAGAEARVGKAREDMPWIETEVDDEFRKWIVDFPERELRIIYELLEKYREQKDVIVFKDRQEAAQYIREISS